MNDNDSLNLEIAVVGLAGRFPGASSTDGLWHNLCAGVESIRDLSEEELRAAGVDSELLADARLVRRAADLAHADRFDAGLFGFTPREAELTDPQFRIFLEDAWSALEDAGYLADRKELRVSVFAGSSASTYLQNNLLTGSRGAQASSVVQASMGNARDYLATQVSYRLDLRGPSLTVQTACSTSLVAVHLACQSLLNRECDVALAGGVSVSVPQTAGYVHTEGDIASPDGRCRAFDAAAAGVVKGNGSGVVVLRRLTDALDDGDTIRAVIKGSAVNNDGNLKVGFTAPSVDGQAGVIEEALAVAGVESETIGFIEAHGTGTPLGDPVELAALTRAFGKHTGRRGRCAIGSIKTNIGHLDAAAGVAGLIKAVLALEHREIPASLHFERPNPKLELEQSPFFVNAELRPWEANAGPRRAGVSSFGIGGTNAHVILEEAPEEPRSVPSRHAQLLVLSAATEAALDAASEALARRLESDPGLPLADAAFTLQVGRKRLAWRRSLVVPDAASAALALREAGRAGSPREDERRATPVAFLFPGQGAQYAGMARALFAREKVFRDVLQRCADHLRPSLGVDLVQLVCTQPGDAAPDERLRETAITQPALFAVEITLARLWMSWGLRPWALAGHSIGEYVAACLAGVWSLEDALGLVAERGRLMGDLPAGAMLAVHLSEGDLSPRLDGHPGLSLAAVNGPRACVVAGESEEVERFEAELRPEDVACRRLHTSHAFHSAMMDPILAAFEERVRSVRLAPPTLPFLSNLTGTWITAEEATDPAYWARHLRSTVRFQSNLEELASDPARVLLEVGPGTALSSLARQTAADIDAFASMPAARSAGQDRESVLEALGDLWKSGVDVDWLAFHGEERRRRIPLPTYAFQRERYWVEAEVRDQAPPADSDSEKEPDQASWFYVPGWKRSHAAQEELDAELPWLVFDDGSDLSAAVVSHAEGLGARVFRVRAVDGEARREEGSFELDPARKDHYGWLLGELRASDAWPCRVVHLWNAGVEGESIQERGFLSLLYLLQSMGSGALCQIWEQ